MMLINRLKRKYKMWRISRRQFMFDKIRKRRIRLAKFYKWYTGHKHYVVLDYRDRIIVVNTLMIEQYKKKRLLKRTWFNNILFETK